MWAFYAVLASICSCIFLFGNQWAKVSPIIFMVYRGWIPTLLLLPLAFFIPGIENWRFYIVCLVQGLIIAFIDYRNFRAIRVWGAETISSIHPFSIGVVFLIWMLLKPANVLLYLEDLPRFLVIVAALAGVVVSVSGYRHTRNGQKALKYMLPYLLFFGIGDICNKLAMGFVQANEVVYGSYWYILITAAVVGIVNFALYLYKNCEICQLASCHNLKYTLAFVPLIALMLFKNLAMFNTPNPSYVTAVLYLYVLWVALTGMIIRHFSKHSRYKVTPLKKVLLLLVSVIALILFGK